MVLLVDRSQDASADFDSKSFYGDRLYSSLPGNQTYTEIEKAEMKYFKMIQIVSETEVREVCNFVHPIFEQG